MHPHAANTAAQPHLSLSIFSMSAASCEERNRGGKKLSFPRAFASSIAAVWADFRSREALGRHGPVGFIRLVSRPLPGHGFGAKPAPCGTASFCFAFSAPAGSRFLPREVCKHAARAPHKLLSGPSQKALLGTWEPGPLAHVVNVTRAGYGNYNETEITTMYQNKVTLIGFLGNDAEVRSNDNRCFTTLSLATKSSYKKDGQYVSHTEWHRCVVFGKKLAEFAGTLKKGAHLQVEGELRSREYQPAKVGKKQPEKKTIWEIRVDSILKLDRAEKSGPEEQEAADPTSEEAAF